MLGTRAIPEVSWGAKACGGGHMPSGFVAQGGGRCSRGVGATCDHRRGGDATGGFASVPHPFMRGAGCQGSWSLGEWACGLGTLEPRGVRACGGDLSVYGPLAKWSTRERAANSSAPAHRAELSSLRGRPLSQSGRLISSLPSPICVSIYSCPSRPPNCLPSLTD